MSKVILPTTLNTIVEKIRSALREYENDKGSYKGFEWYIPENNKE
jgi:hypothetical protein